jgi:hypothetical protein
MWLVDISNCEIVKKCCSCCKERKEETVNGHTKSKYYYRLHLPLILLYFQFFVEDFWPRSVAANGKNAQKNLAIKNMTVCESCVQKREIHT